MLHESLCAFCQKLPVLTGHPSGRESHCPLCKAKLLTKQGTLYRHAEEEEEEELVAAAPAKSWWQRLV